MFEPLKNLLGTFLGIIPAIITGILALIGAVLGF
jgi:hypothetical protein